MEVMDRGAAWRDAVRMTTPPHTWLAWARLYLHTFRVIVVGGCAAIAVYGWLAHIDWMFAAGLCIGIGELLECTYYLSVLGWGERTRRLGHRV